MASTYSTNLAIQLIGTGDQAGQWGVSTNTNLGTLIEQAISGVVTQTFADADLSLPMPAGADGGNGAPGSPVTARNLYINCTGTNTAVRSLLMPSNKTIYFIGNFTTGGFALTVKCSGGVGVSVPNGAVALLVCNGIDVFQACTNLTSLIGPTSLLSSASTALTLTGPANNTTYAEVIKSGNASGATIAPNLWLQTETGTAIVGNGTGIAFGAMSNNGGTTGIPVALVASSLVDAGSGGVATDHSGALLLQTKNTTDGAPVTRWTINKTGGMFAAGATGGDKGAGTLNAINMYVNGAAVVVSGGIITATEYDRTAAGKGYLSGGYSTLETGTTTGPIYCINTPNYAPTSLSLATMYGVGYTNTLCAGIGGGVSGCPSSGNWVFYVAGGGSATIVMDSGAGSIYNSGNHIAKGAISAGTAVSGLANGDMSSARTATQGYHYYGSNGLHYMGYDGSQYNFAPGTVLVNGALNATGNITAFFSDMRLKDVQGPITDALAKVNTLDGFLFKANHTAQALGYDANEVHAGLSAQAVEAILPEIIRPAPADPQYKTLDYGDLVPLLVEAIKELTEKVSKLEAKLNGA